MKRSSERGAILPFLAVALPVLIAALGLVIDNGAMYELKRRTQTAADAGALAGAHELHRSNPAGVKTASLYDAKQNGFEADADVDGLVTVNNPPTAGRYAGDPAFVEVIVEERAPLFFMTAFMDEGYLVRARSVAGARPDNHCLYVLNDTDRDAFNVAGTANVEFTNCGVMVNSKNGTAARTNGGGTAKAKRFDVTGDYSGEGFSPEPYTGQPPMSDPLQDVKDPDVGPCDYSKKKVNSVETLDPGVYCDGLDFTSTAVATLKPGTYIINGGGLTVGAGSTVIGVGVTFYITESPGHNYDAITVNGNSVFQVSAPISGDLKGMLFFEDRTIEDTGEHKFNGTADVILTGTIYTPNAAVKIAGDFEGAGEAQKIMLVVDTLTITGNPQFAAADTSMMPIEVLIPRIVE